MRPTSDKACNKLDVILRSSARAPTVSKDGRKHGGCFHPSRRPGGSAGDLLRMTCLFFVLGVFALPATLARAQTIEEKAQACSACHGENGVPQDKATPVIAGQHQGYLYL